MPHRTHTNPCFNRVACDWQTAHTHRTARVSALGAPDPMDFSVVCQDFRQHDQKEGAERKQPEHQCVAYVTTIGGEISQNNNQGDTGRWGKM